MPALWVAILGLCWILWLKGPVFVKVVASFYGWSIVFFIVFVRVGQRLVAGG
jgi:hypothetical protein